MYTTNDVSELTGLKPRTILQYVRRYGIGSWSSWLKRWLFSDYDLSIIEERKRK